MLKIENACIEYDNHIVLNNFCLTVEDGEVVCISGESGCGKTSILNAIMGFVPLRSGSISFNGTLLSPATIDSIRKDIAWLPQELSLPSEQVSEMVQLPFTLKANKGIRFSKAKLFEYFDRLNLEHELYSKLVSEISGGQRQRIMIAVAAMLNKKLIIADEPTSALDTFSADKVMDFFHQLASKGTSILLVSHNEQVGTSANRHIILS
jgi:putative ABC transport system ATP-binding protein